MLILSYFYQVLTTPLLDKMVALEKMFFNSLHKCFLGQKPTRVTFYMWKYRLKNDKIILLHYEKSAENV